MSTETGVVVDVQGDHLVVETRRQGTCGACAARAGCGAALIGRALGRRRSHVRAVSGLRLKPGDEVSLSMDEGRVLHASMLMYGLPLLGLLSGALAAELLGAAEWVVVIAGAAGLIIGLGMVRRRACRLQADARFRPLVTGILQKHRD